MNRIKLIDGTYRAETQVIVALYQGQQQIEYTTHQPGEVFEVNNNGTAFRKYATYHPDFGDTEPQFTRID